MNTLNTFAAKKNNFHNQFIPSFDQHCSVLTKQPLNNSLSYRTQLPLSLSSSYLPIKSSFSIPKTLKSQPFKHSFLKPTLISTITATTLFLTGFYINPKPAISTPLSPPPTVDTTTINEDNTKNSLEEDLVSNPNDVDTTANEAVSENNTKNALEEELLSNSNDVDILRNLLENHIKNRELVDALSILNKLIELESNEIEWCFLKSHLYVHNGELELAKLGFREVISKDPYHVEAYRGLVVVAGSEVDSLEEMKEIEKEVEEGIKMCEEENRKDEMRDFKLLLAQIWVIEGKYEDALKFYHELVDEEPSDFRPYLCQGMIYTMLKKNDEAEKYFEKYRGLVPRENPNARFEFMMAT
ncbi:protein slow green 1, chloroplastic [Nicotiana attenuata]|uniref:Protein slow green 1, chloroplastic n=1 Tax=Nicotiana attenuata TaxID=49451 RepID=A0A1J6IRQ7_NICAT|nr:protein slow green 1, chloroplastic [Nicotiana attenuata]